MEELQFSKTNGGFSMISSICIPPASYLLNVKKRRANFAPKIGCYGWIKESSSSRADV